MPERGLRDLFSGEHPGDLVHPLPAFEEPHGRDRAPLLLLLLGTEVTVGQRRDLRHVRHAENLSALPQRAELLSNGLRRPAPDPRVHLVEDERPPPAAPRRRDRLHGELEA